jgi:alpha-glucosidase
VPDAVAIRVDPKPIHTASAPDTWWRHAVIYQIYPRSWSDSGGDGIGDLPGITERFEYLARLGVDAVWLSPFYVSPQNDGGYDVADYRDVDPVFGRLEDADKLIATAHDYGIRIIIDLVPNHSSSEHPWFQAALRAAPGSPERARYIFRDGRGASGALPPNNWLSNFGGAGWTRVTEADGRLGQWYLHIFDVTQPDFDWSNDEVRAEMEAVIRFWLDRGIDGFRIDVAHGLVKRAGLPDGVTRQQPTGEPTARQPMWDQPGVHEIYRAWRKLLNSYNASGPDAELADEDRILCAEAWVHPPEALARYVRPDELHQSFNFDFLLTPWLAPELRDVIEHTLRVADDVGAPQTWVLSNHDVVRYATRLGYPAGAGLLRFSGIGADDAQPDAALGLRRARAAAAVMLALPGSCYLYQGEELGLPDATQLPDEVRQDPTWRRSGHTQRGRDGCRVPLPWLAEAPSYGFGPSARSWLPQPPSFRELAVDRQDGVHGSTLELYRAYLSARREHGLGHGGLYRVDGYPDDVLAFVNAPADNDRLILLLANLGPDPVPLPNGAQIIVASNPLTDDGRVPTDVAVWAALAPAG